MKIILTENNVIRNIPKGKEVEVANSFGVGLINQGKAIDPSGKVQKKKSTTKINKK